MPRGHIVLTLSLGLAGCYLDLTAGASKTAGGVKGYGWEIGLAGGFGWDIGGAIRPSAGLDGSMARTSAEDGKFGTTGFSYHGRLDVAVSGTHEYSSSELSSHAGMGDSSGTTGQTRMVLDYGRGKQELQFTSPDVPMTFKKDSTVHSFYLGIAREYNWKGSVAASFGIGPHVTYMPNEFVGDATAAGLQVHASYWFAPVFRKRKTGSLMEHYTPSDPIKPLPERNPDPVNCPSGTLDANGRPC